VRARTPNVAAIGRGDSDHGRLLNSYSKYHMLARQYYGHYNFSLRKDAFCHVGLFQVMGVMG
jgi:hypothetical protein